MHDLVQILVEVNLLKKRLADSRRWTSTYYDIGDSDKKTDSCDLTAADACELTAVGRACGNIAEEEKT